MKRGSSWLIALILGCSLLCACGEDYVPKPKAWNYIPLPEPAYQPLDSTYPYAFEYSKYAYAVDDTTGFHGKDWIIIKYPQWHVEVHMTYYPVPDELARDTLIDDSYRISYKHDVKASAIEPRQFGTARGYPAVTVRLEGEVPSAYQFFVFDTTAYPMDYLRAAMYLPIATKNDSLQPIIDFVIEDMDHMLQTLEWKAKG